jgi:lactate dehydrogenase-like 2-hydroxyacid dehydrogenase
MHERPFPPPAPVSSRAARRHGGDRRARVRGDAVIVADDAVIAGAALDVLDAEPPAVDDPIYTLPNVICFPHIGSATEETRRAMRELAVENLLAVLAGKRPPAPVNPEVLP